MRCVERRIALGNLKLKERGDNPLNLLYICKICEQPENAIASEDETLGKVVHFWSKFYDIWKSWKSSKLYGFQRLWLIGLSHSFSLSRRAVVLAIDCRRDMTSGFPVLMVLVASLRSRLKT
ncbi:hypothetical protein QYE76_035976 [Lolium multiflorum]|uniref:Uncharacterized protein n=1 Tax=Lolium multiflorum TaxID=4521 RepID=A0AAD8VPR1_LOLMU|nr:hypothetical protein QYE76_035976 [Lolium multiflorum]